MRGRAAVLKGVQAESPSLSGLRRLAILTVFAMHGAIVGSQLSRLPEIQAAIGISKDEFGLALSGIPAGAIFGSQLVGRLIEKRGVRNVLLMAVPYFGASLMLAPFAYSAASLFACLLLFGLGLSSVNVTMNVEADRVEAATAGRLMNRCHAIWAVGFLGASLCGTAAVAAAISPSIHFAVVLLVSIAVTATIIAPMAPSPPRLHAGTPKAPRFAAPTTGVLLVFAFAFSGIVLEGASRSWSIIYLRDDLAAAGWVATLALPSFIVWQMTGRFLADGLIDRFGPVLTARALTALSLCGLLVLTTAQSVAPALLGFALIGLGISTVHPQAISAVAQLGDRPSSLNVAALSTAQIVIGFLTPPVFGLIAGTLGIRYSFLFVAPLPLIALYCAKFLAPKTTPTRETIGSQK